MKAIAVFLLFLGTILVLQGYYGRKDACPPPKTEIRFIPRTLYEEQLSPAQHLESQFKSMFEDVDPWLYAGDSPVLPTIEPAVVPKPKVPVATPPKVSVPALPQSAAAAGKLQVPAGATS